MRSIIIIACLAVSFTTAYAASIDFGSNVKVKAVNKDDFTNFAPGQPLEVKSGEAYFVVPEEGMPLLVVSPSNDSAKISLASSTGNVSRTLVQPLIDKTLNELMDETQRIHTLVEKRNLADASSRIRTLKDKFPQISSVHFLSGTINFLSNNKKLALEDIERGLSIDPANEAGKRMREKLQRAQ